MKEYERLYHRAEVLERWANIYLGDSALADWARFTAAVDRFQAEVIKAARIEELAHWISARVSRWTR